MKTTSNPRLVSLLAGLTVLALSSATSVLAGDILWNPEAEIDGGSTSWASGLNWTGGVAPADNLSGDIAVFGATSAYNFQPELDAFTVRSVHGLRFSGTSAVTLSAGGGTRLTVGATAANSSTLVLNDVTGIAVGQQLLTGSGYAPGTFVTAVDTETNTITLSRPRNTSALADGSTMTFASSLRIGAEGITRSAGTHTITAPIVLGANQIWDNQASGTLAIQGAVYLDNHTLTLQGAANSLITFNGYQGGNGSDRQSIGGTGGIVIDTDGTVEFGAGNGNPMQSSFTGGVTLDKGTLRLHGGNAGGSAPYGALGTGVLTINGGRITGGGNIANRPVTISGQVWNADWEFGGGRSIDMGTGGISLGTAPGTSRTLTANSGSYILTLGGGISDGDTANTFIKDGSGHVILNGINTHTGDTIVEDGTVTLGQPGAFTLYIGADGVNNALTGDGVLNLDGSFIFDLSEASPISGNSWTIIASSLFANTTFGDTFSVADFVQDGNLWTNGGFVFSQDTGILTYGVIPEPTAFAVLGGIGVLLATLGQRRRSRAAV